VASLSKQEIQTHIPHRDPFLWIDEVPEVSERRIVARKFVDATIDAFRGHFPGKPVFPGVLLVEAAMQAGGVLLARLPAGRVPAGHVPVVTRINNVKFRRMVRPGDTLEIEVELDGNVENAFFLEAKVMVGGKLAAQFSYSCATAEFP
jgi:3-hydroxyacyl-[acyl-carrier-protein] dehydratase